MVHPVCSSVMLDTYLQQTTSADVILQMIFFGALRVNTMNLLGYMHCKIDLKKIVSFAISITCLFLKKSLSMKQHIF